MNCSKYKKMFMRSSAFLNLGNDEKYCLFWSKVAHIHRCDNNNPNRVSDYTQNFNELNIDGVDFSNGLKCSDQ